MLRSNYEIRVNYSAWDVLVFDSNGRALTELKCQANHFFSNHRSGTYQFDHDRYAVRSSSGGIILSQNDMDIGDVKIFVKGSTGRQAAIQIKKETFYLHRQDLIQVFSVVDTKDQTVITIEGKLHKDKQKNLFGLIYFDNTLFYTTMLHDNLTDEKKGIQLMVVCGYCIRTFLEIDMGDFTGKIHRG